MAVAGGVLLVSGLPPLASGGGTVSPIKVVGLKQIGNLVEVVLFNSGTTEITGKMVIPVTTSGAKNLVFIPFTVWGGQKVSLVWQSPVPLEPFQEAGIIVDDGAPI
jgi:hypothetical protein